MFIAAEWWEWIFLGMPKEVYFGFVLIAIAFGVISAIVAALKGDL